MANDFSDYTQEQLEARAYRLMRQSRKVQNELQQVSQELDNREQGNEDSGGEDQ